MKAQLQKECSFLPLLAAAGAMLYPRPPEDVNEENGKS
jgi:hypothetical protein